MKVGNIINKFGKKTVNKITRTKARAGLKLKKHSPEIFLALGIVSFGGTVVLACKATLSADDILEHHKKKMKDINEAAKIAEENPDDYEYDTTIMKRDKTIQTFHTGVAFAKLYGPAVAMGIISIGCILVSRNIMQKRYLTMVAAYESTKSLFETYRKRVIEREGAIMDRHYMYGTELDMRTEKATLTDGTEVSISSPIAEKPNTLVIPDDDTARWFEVGNPYWDSNRDYAIFALRSRQNYCNDLLKSRGHIFLNEVYDSLGFPHTQLGAMVGWILGSGDDCVDFGMWKPENSGFINGTDDKVLITFNHDGVIIDKI